MSDANTKQDKEFAEDINKSIMDALDDSIKQEANAGFFSVKDVDNLEGNDLRIDDILKLAKGSDVSSEVLDIIKKNMPEYVSEGDSK